jgi:glyoxylase-like metal-dependent hydrolase (beta-lactamase superfamily II)
MGLLDTGCGSPAWFSEKERKIHGLEENWALMLGLESAGVAPDHIQFVVHSHLHWDHAGGTAHVDDDDALHITFPNAKHYAHRKEWDDATSGDPLLHRAYPDYTIQPLLRMAESHITLIEEDDAEVLPGIRMRRSGGHTHGHCAIELTDDVLEINHASAHEVPPLTKAVYAGDVCPMQHNMRIAYGISYDLYPLETRVWKRSELPDIAAAGSLLLYIHDPDSFGGIIVPDERKEFVLAVSLATH